MTDPRVARQFLLSEVEALEPFDLVAVLPDGQPLHLVETTRGEDGSLEVRVPGRPPMAPELSPEVRQALEERGFVSEDPTNRTLPFVRGVEGAEAAVDLVQALLVEVFDAKPDAKLDVAHGSHRAEHEARERLARARARIEPIIEDMLGEPPRKDDDGDYLVPIQDVHVMIAPRATMDGQVVIRVFAITNVGVQVTPELGLFLARLNFGLMFGRFALDAEHGSIWFDENILGAEFREEELRFAIKVVGSSADGWDDRLKQMFGGVTYQEVLAGRAQQEPPLLKPGAGAGQYL